jgi:secondary thiamine-phosphate synthase enzyme
MTIKNKTITIETKETLEFTDVTPIIKNFVEKTGVENGLVNIQSMHTTATLILNENEPLLIKDIKKNLSDLAPEDIDYNHDNFDVRTVNMCDDECANGHAHCKATYLTPTNTINLIDGELQLGTWQRILFIELDRARTRKVQIQVMGE